MCANVTVRTEVEGSAKGPKGWVRVDTANVSFDHPFHAPFEHSLNIDFVSERAEGVSRVAIELSADAARALVDSIMFVLAQGEAEAGLLPSAAPLALFEGLRGIRAEHAVGSE